MMYKGSDTGMKDRNGRAVLVGDRLTNGDPVAPKHYRIDARGRVVDAADVPVAVDPATLEVYRDAEMNLVKSKTASATGSAATPAKRRTRTKASEAPVPAKPRTRAKAAKSVPEEFAVDAHAGEQLKDFVRKLVEALDIETIFHLKEQGFSGELTKTITIEI